MDLTMFPKHAEGYLEVTAKGPFEQREATRVLREAFEAAARFGLDRVLIDVREVSGVPTTADRFDFGAAMGDLQKEYLKTIVLKVAVVGDEPLIDPRRFGQTVARNRGAMVQVGTDRELAKAFLDL